MLSVAQSAGPSRTCVGCRRVEPLGELVRLAIGPGGQIAVDHPRKLGGRGAWVHATRSCLKDAVRRGAIARALECGRVSFTASELADALRTRFVQRAQSLLSAARRAGRAEVGSDAVAAAIRAGEAQLVVIAMDAAASSKLVEEAVRARSVPPPVVRFETKAGLGRLWSRDTLGVVAVTDAGLAEEIASEIARVGAVADVAVG